ncbi:MAG: RNA-processing protein [Archaeoglobaceae archaeon]|nr:RNA-processing protein [Archaeoglobaceae archaeon]
MNKIEMKLPKSRIGVLIGKDGKVIKKIEDATNCKIEINPKTETVKIECEDALGFLKAKDIVNAIASGFNAETALKLLEGDFTILEIIDLSDFVPSSAMQRIKGRIIGKEGRMKKTIEDMLAVNVSIQDKTVAIIGEAENVNAAREAIMMLIDGAQHSTVQRFLERKRRDIKMRSFDYDWMAYNNRER